MNCFRSSNKVKSTIEEQQDEIFDYFKDDAETDSIEEAMEEFEEEYDEEELRLMRIKFLSELAN